jgi:hypothetical protein|tara:strand:- start:5393 stop:5614 length:222 start_codon:yes stop_codon:yes gene_type:complete
MENENEQTIKDKVDFFMEEKVPVHVKLFDKTFLNGIIIKKLRDNVYWMEERKLGEVFLFIKDIYDVKQLEVKV